MNITKAAKLSVQNVLKEGLTDIFPHPYELNLLNNSSFQNIVVSNVVHCIDGNSLESLDVSQIEHVLLPKGGPFDFRRCGLVHPLDTIKYLALVLLFADELEKVRPLKSRKIVFSYRFKPQKDYLFDPNYNITEFTKYVAKKLRQKDTKILVSCDIANYYDRLNLHRLESILLSLDFDKSKVKQLNELLLFWANRNSYSLPVGSNASRILAEAALLEVDNYLLSVGVKFCRFVDDYRLFAPDALTAHYWLTLLIERLWIEGLTINQRKTKIEDVSNLIRSEKKVNSTPANEEQEAPEKKAQPIRIMAGYGGLIPTRFRNPSSAELKNLRDTNPQQMYNSIKSKKIPEPEDITLFCKSIIATKKYHYFEYLPELAELFPQFTPYIVDVLIKHKESISHSGKQQIKNRFSKRLRSGRYIPEYVKISIVQLLGYDDFEDKDTLFTMFRELKRNAGAYIGRSLLDALEPFVTRNEVLEIRSYFSRADAWEKRQIVRIVDMHLSDEEKRPWLKNIRTQEARDLFLSEYISPAKTKQKKKKKS